ncbi:MAG TPA: CapA family protein [Bacteroidales bacterium]|nr:CapA family protein [Bacteroidales bacterium]
MRKDISIPRYFLIVTLLLGAVSYAECQELTDSSNTVSLLLIGDIMGHDEQIRSAENMVDHSFTYDDVFKYIKPVIIESDIAVANFEVTLAGPPYKGYPRFSSPASLAAACKNCSIGYLVTANNHSADRGNQGIINTINRLDSLGIPHTGTFSDQAAKDSLSPLIIKKNGIAIAVMNYTFSTNGINVPKPVIVNMLEKEEIEKDIARARQKAADFIVLFLHWGREYDTIPSSYQVSLAKYFLSAGADIVIGSHPHVLQKMVLTSDSTSGKDNMVVYSLGNFITNQRKPRTDGGAMVRLVIGRSEKGLKIINAGYYLTWVYTPVQNYRKKFYILPCSEFENNPGFFSEINDFRKMKYFIAKARSLMNTSNTGVPEIRFNDSTSVLKY